jgi:hypothetical protein
VLTEGIAPELNFNPIGPGLSLDFASRLREEGGIRIQLCYRPASCCGCKTPVRIANPVGILRKVHSIYLQ